MSTNNSSSPASQIIPVLILFLGLFGLYYLYQYLFGVRTLNSYQLITKTQDASAAGPINMGSDKLAPLFEGGEFTISTWLYISDWGVRRNRHKHILSIGGSSFQTIGISLGATKPSLRVRLQTCDRQSTSFLNNDENGTPCDTLHTKQYNKMFTDIQMDSGLLESTPLCDLPEVDLQRWINLTVAVNGRTVDVYLDGKLSRSCVLPAPFKVDTSGYRATILGHGGFGGKISTTTMYDRALNPEAVHTNYMAGPEPILSLSQWFSSFFEPSVSSNVSSNSQINNTMN